MAQEASKLHEVKVEGPNKIEVDPLFLTFSIRWLSTPVDLGKSYIFL